MSDEFIDRIIAAHRQAHDLDDAAEYPRMVAPEVCFECALIADNQRLRATLALQAESVEAPSANLLPCGHDQVTEDAMNRAADEIERLRQRLPSVRKQTLHDVALVFADTSDKWEATRGTGDYDGYAHYAYAEGARVLAAWAEEPWRMNVAVHAARRIETSGVALEVPADAPTPEPLDRWGRCPNCGTEHTGDDCTEQPPVASRCTGLSCPCWLSFEGMALADIKAVFAADGTFSIDLVAGDGS